jgi:hypothetical protein
MFRIRRQGTCVKAGSRYSQCHDESMDVHVPPSPLHSGKKRSAEMLVFFYILKKESSKAIFLSRNITIHTYNEEVSIKIHANKKGTIHF